MRLIDGDGLRTLVPMDRAIAAVEEAFRSRVDETPPRGHIPIGDAELLFMPSWNPRVAGVKLVTVSPDNPAKGLPLINGSYILFDRPGLQPRAVIEAAALTALRTAAVSGIATRALAAPDARRLVIFGAGVQAHAHLEAMVAVRPIEEIAVVSRSEDRAVALVERARAMGVGAGIASPDTVATADVVCTCTTSSDPVFDGADLSPGAHVNAVGSYRTDARELDTDSVARAAVVVVETLEVMGESGDLAGPLGTGDLTSDEVVEIGDILDRPKPDHPEITVFKSVGRAFEDLAVAEAAVAELD